MNSIRIAFCGAFDIANYGDHLFPTIFKEAMRERSIDCDVILFAPTNNKAFFQDEKVYSLLELPAMVESMDIHAIIVGGGELIHYSSNPQRMQTNATEYKKYRIFETWIVPSLVGLKYGVQVLWNAPGGSYEFPDFYRSFTRSLCHPVSYLSVRNISTKQILSRCGIAEDSIHVCPDTALLMKRYFSAKSLEHTVDSLLPIKRPYVVFHANRHIPLEAIGSVVEILIGLEEKGYEVVLLPLAYTHGDEELLTTIQSAAANRFTTLPRLLSISDIMAVLSRGHIYIGISFHGAITALSYGCKAIIYDYTGSIKSKDLFDYLHLSSFYARNVQELRTAIDTAFEGYPMPNFEQALEELDDHFDIIATHLTSAKRTKTVISGFISDTLEGFDLLTSSFKEEYNAVYQTTLASLLPDVVHFKCIRKTAKEYITDLANDIVDISKERDVLIEDNRSIREERDVLLADNLAIRAERDILLADNISLREERNILLVHTSAIQKELDSYR